MIYSEFADKDQKDEKAKFAGGMTEKALLSLSWKGEIFGVGLLETLRERFPEHAEILTAGAMVEWFNVHLIEEFAHAGGIHASVESAANLAQKGAAFARHLPSFEFMCKLMQVETAEVLPLFKALTKRAGTPELVKLGEDLYEHEIALRDWCKSELDGKSDKGEKIFAYLERHGISREEAVIPRQLSKDVGGDKQQLVLATFADEAAADGAARTLKSWEKGSEYLKFDKIGVLTKDKNGEIKVHRLDKHQGGRKGLGIGLALGLVSAVLTGGVTLAAGAVVGGIGLAGGIVGRHFDKRIKASDEDVARVKRELEEGRAMAGVLAWDSETDAVVDQLKKLGGGTPLIIELAKAESTKAAATTEAAATSAV